MIRAGFTFEHPTTKTRTVILESDAETNGLGWLLEITRYSKLSSHLGEHLHQTWTETFEIIKGTTKYKLDGNEKIANAGEAFVVEPGHFHVYPRKNRMGKSLFLKTYMEIYGICYRSIQIIRYANAGAGSD